MDPLWNPLKNPYRSPPKPYSILIIKAQILGPADLNKYPKHSDPECLKPRPPETLTAITRNKRHIGALILRIGFWSPLDYIHRSPTTVLAKIWAPILCYRMLSIY